MRTLSLRRHFCRATALIGVTAAVGQKSDVASVLQDASLELLHRNPCILRHERDEGIEITLVETSLIRRS